MSAYLKQTDYVNAYDLARDKKVIEGQAKLSDLPRLKDMILPTEGTVTYKKANKNEQRNKQNIPKNP